MNLLPVRGGIIVKAKERILSLRSVTQVGFVPGELRYHDHRMESLVMFAHRDVIALRVLKSQSSAPLEPFQITQGTAMRATAPHAQRALIVKPRD